MRLTSILNIGLLGIVLITCLGGILTWLSISVLRDQLEITRVAEEITDKTDGLNDTLRQFQRAENDVSEEDVRQRIELVGSAVVNLARTGAPDHIIEDLKSAKQNYAAAFDAYVEQGLIKNRALQTVNNAAVSLKDRATSEASKIADENAHALTRAEQIERRQKQAFLAAQRVTEILVAVSRARQAADTLVETGAQGPKRTVTAALDRIRANIGDFEELDETIIDRRRLAVLSRWLDVYSSLVARAADADQNAEDISALKASLSRAAAPFQTEADRLRDSILATLRSAIGDANTERERLFEVSRRNGQLGQMHQSLSNVLMKVRLLRANLGRNPEDLGRGMAEAVDKLRQSTDKLFPPRDHRFTPAISPPPQTTLDSGHAQQGGVVGITFAIAGLEHAWRAAVTAAVEQQVRSFDMTEAASDSEAVIRLAREQVEETLENAIVDFLVLISIAIALAILSSALVTSYVYRYVTRPLAQLTGSITCLAKGDLNVPVPKFQTGIELTELAEAAEVLRRSSLERIELERQNARNERRLVEERAEAEKLELSLRKEQEKMQLQRKFVAMVSHEFRTPLAIIDGQAQGIMRRLDRIESEALGKRIKKVRTAVERLVALMESMLSSSRMEAGTIEFKPEDHDLQELVAEICAHQTEVNASHDIVANVEALPKHYQGDPNLLRQVFTNLISNAVKYSPDAKRVDVTAVEDTQGLHIHVRDYGVGIPKDELPKLSSQFFRASTSAGIAGTGIGLHLVKAFITMHGGSMTVSSVVDEGSTFTATLPRTDRQLAA